MLGQIIAVFLVLALLLALLWAMRKRGLARLNFAVGKRLTKQRFIEVLERVPLTAQHSLHLVRVENRMILVGVSPAGCNQIDSFVSVLSTGSQEECA